MAGGPAHRRISGLIPNMAGPIQSLALRQDGIGDSAARALAPVAIGDCIWQRPRPHCHGEEAQPGHIPCAPPSIPRPLTGVPQHSAVPLGPIAPPAPPAPLGYPWAPSPPCPPHPWARSLSLARTLVQTLVQTLLQTLLRHAAEARC
eukprot:4890637-Prymnesium_polylepis.1